MKEKCKAIYVYQGKVKPPLLIGRPAIIAYQGEYKFTRPVMSIRGISRDGVVFETDDSIYCLVPLLPPTAAEGLTERAGAAA